MSSKSKRQSKGQDRISGLPDEVLWHILSLLPTKYVVRTCILSTRWKNTWASVPYLDFDLGERGDFHSAAELLTFVDHVLFFRYSSNIQKFRLLLRYHVIEHSRIIGWIHTAVRRNVVELDLLVDIGLLQSGILELPKCLFMSKTLRILKLTSNFIINIPKSGWLPSLKFLHVRFHYLVHDSMFKLFSSFPVLEDLTIDGCLGPRVSYNFEVAAPALKTLTICYYTGEAGYNILIKCPKLENLYLRGNVVSNYNLGKVESLVKASIGLLHHCSDEDPGFSSVTALVAEVSNVEYLCLSAHCFEVAQLPAFKNLRQLKLVLLDCFCWELLNELLKRSPVLESLVLEREISHCIEKESEHEEGSEHEDESESESEEGSEDSESEEGSEDKEDSEYEEGSEHEEGLENEESSKNEEGSEDEEGSEHWNPPESVPISCLSHLKFVSFRGFAGQRNEMEMAKYLLKCGEVLTKMTIAIYNLDLNGKAKLYKEFLLVPRGSRTCIVEFI